MIFILGNIYFLIKRNLITIIFLYFSLLPMQDKREKFFLKSFKIVTVIKLAIANSLIVLYISSTGLSGLVSRCVYPINVETAEPIEHNLLRVL